MLAALGVWVAVECTRRTAGPAAAGVGAVLLIIAGAWAWKLIGRTGMNPTLFAGGAVAAIAVVRAQVATKSTRPVAGSAIEDLIRALMEFLHGAGEGVPSEGVVDAARKSVTKVAYLAQEMVDSMDDEERYAMLKERLEARGRDFLDTTYQRVAVVLSLAKSAGFIAHEAGQMSRAADRMRAAITTILSDAPVQPPVLKQQLLAIKEARDQLATAADRAWAIVQTNPGCSLTHSIDLILEEKRRRARGGPRQAWCEDVPRRARRHCALVVRVSVHPREPRDERHPGHAARRRSACSASRPRPTCRVLRAHQLTPGAGMDEATAAQALRREGRRTRRRLRHAELASAAAGARRGHRPRSNSAGRGHDVPR